MSSSRPSHYTLTSPGRLRLYSLDELLRLPPPEWLIEPIIPYGGLIGLYGQPGHGKSFVAIDMAMSVATRLAWHQHPTKAGYVLYVSAEGGVGIAKRFNAWRTHYGVRPGGAHIAILTESLPIYGDSEDVDRLIDRLEYEVLRYPTLVVIDTLARCFDGDENTQLDMGRFVKGIDRLRREYGAAIIVIHHTRLGGDRERGNTAFRGAADTMILVERHQKGTIELSCNKQRDDEEFPSETYVLSKVAGTGSCVTLPALQEKRLKVLEILQIGPLSFTDLKLRTKAQGVSLATMKRALVSLQESGQIAKKSELWEVI